MPVRTDDGVIEVLPVLGVCDRRAVLPRQREVPLGRLVSAREDALFAAYLCSSAADCFVGQVFPVCGGWVGR